MSERYVVKGYRSVSSGENVYQVWDTLLGSWVYETGYKPAATEEAGKRNKEDAKRYEAAFVG